LQWGPAWPTRAAVNPRVVINHGQARALVTAVRQPPSGERLVAFFAVMYYSAPRPGEAVDLRKEAVSLPAKGWGELYLTTSAPSAGRSWSRSGTGASPVSSSTAAPRGPHRPVLTGADRIPARTPRGARHDSRWPPVPRSPWGLLSESLYGRVWATARTTALTPEEAASPLARRPPTRRDVDMAQQWSSRASGRGLGRAQRRRPATGLRPVHRRPGARRPPKDRGGPS
jgi:integrase